MPSNSGPEVEGELCRSAGLSHLTPGCRIVYMAPYGALCSEFGSMSLGGGLGIAFSSFYPGKAS